jgi:hypothetical protein
VDDRARITSQQELRDVTFHAQRGHPPFATPRGIGRFELEELLIKRIGAVTFRFPAVSFIQPSARRRGHPPIVLPAPSCPGPEWLAAGPVLFDTVFRPSSSDARGDPPSTLYMLPRAAFIPRKMKILWKNLANAKRIKIKCTKDYY